MKIDLAVVSYDKDPQPKGSGNGDADRGAMGDAFGKAVRDAESKRPAPSQDKPEAGAQPKPPATGDAKKADAPKADADTGVAADGKADAEADAAGSAAKDTAPLQSLLGALAALTAPKGDGKDDASARTDGGKGGGEDASAVPDPKLGKALPTAETAAKDKKPMQLDVLRMETHFEPRQDGMVLVEGAADAAKLAGTADAEAKTPKSADPLASTLAELAKAKAADGGSKPAGDKPAAKDDGSLPPMRFDEALAQLGRGGERSDGNSSRDGSASAQAALAELAARRSAAKGADGVAASTAVADPLPSASPFNLAVQVAGPIMDALGEPAQATAQSSSSASSDAHLRMRAGGGALKTLTIQLHPEHLGTVDVSMRLNEGRLTLELAASRSDTASMLLDDQASLRKLLEHAGFSLDDAAISVITRDSGQIRTADSGASNAQQRDGSPNGGAGDARPDARSQSGGSDDQPSRRRPATRPSDDASPKPARTGATYL